MNGGRATGRLRWRVAALLALAAVYYAIPNARPDFTRFNCHDSESYLALSYSLTHGMGYTRSLAPNRHIAHEMWPPGTPLLLAPATMGAGPSLDWARVKRTVATLGLFGLIPVWLWVRRLRGAESADVATFTLALNPFYWHFSHQAMAELPLFLWLVFGLWWIDRSWSDERLSARAAFGGGLLCGVGMLIKGHVAALALAPLAYLGRGQASRRVSLWLIFCLGFALPFAGWLARNATIEAPGPDGFSQLQQVRMADPMDPASASRDATSSLTSMFTNLRHYAIYHVSSQVLPGLWPTETFAWKGSGWLAAALVLLLIATAWRRQRATVAAFLVLAFLGALNLLYGYGGSPRFWVPVSLLLLLLGTTHRAEAFSTLDPRWRRVLAVALALALAANLAGYIGANERQPYNSEGPWSELAALFHELRGADLETEGVLTPNPHAFQLTTGLAAPMVVGGSTFDHMVARTDGVGPQPPEGARRVTAVEPWALYQLTAPTAGPELIRDPPRYPMRWRAAPSVDPQNPR